MRRLKLTIMLGLALSLLWVVPTVVAQGGDEYPPNVDPDDVYKISRKLHCDVCQGVPLSDCPSQQCQAWREEIGDLLSQGYSEDEIREHFADRYGDKVSGVPLDEEDRFLTYAIPIGFVVLLSMGIGWQVYRWQNQDNQALQVARTAGVHANHDRPVPDNVDSAYLERVLAALEDHRR
ncbi:MAG: hypothetical protein GYB66_14645 [Chloroflexi bacterium]|nr:hypothetical protein [Chloroflexota bacterium]